MLGYHPYSVRPFFLPASRNTSSLKTCDIVVRTRLRISASPPGQPGLIGNPIRPGRRRKRELSRLRKSNDKQVPRVGIPRVRILACVHHTLALAHGCWARRVFERVQRPAPSAQAPVTEAIIGLVTRAALPFTVGVQYSPSSRTLGRLFRSGSSLGSFMEHCVPVRTGSCAITDLPRDQFGHLGSPRSCTG